MSINAVYGCALDRILSAQETLEKEGDFYLDRFGQPKKHPADKQERDSETLLARLLRELNHDMVIPEAPRPPRNR